jgi:hypothetical protein
MSRRQFLAMCACAAGGAASFGGSAAGEKKRCRPTMCGPLWCLDPKLNAEWGPSGWRDELDKQAAIGFDLLWLCGVAGNLDSDSSIQNLRALMDVCAARKVRVILDCGSTEAWYSPLDIDRELKSCGAVIKTIGRELRGHPAFHAWYIPQEIYMAWPDQPMYAYIDKLYPSLVKMCKAAVDVPVSLSPFFILDKDKVFGDFRYNEPQDYERYWARLLKLSGIDILMLQDSGEHFSYVTNDQRRPFFEAMSRACRTAGTRFWGNVETAEYVCPSKEEFVRLYGRVHHSAAKGLPWRPVPIDRLREKLDLAAEFSEEIVTWGYREFCRPSLGDAARKWYEDYKAYYRSVR